MADPRAHRQHLPSGLPCDPAAEATLAAIAITDKTAARHIHATVPEQAWTDWRRHAIVEAAAACELPPDTASDATANLLANARAGIPDDACDKAGVSARADHIARTSGVPRPILSQQLDQQLAARDTNGWYAQRVLTAAADRKALVDAAERASRRTATSSEVAEARRVWRAVGPRRRSAPRAAAQPGI